MEESTIINMEEGESSNSEDMLFVCKICTDTKTISHAFNISGCSHAYCSDCVAMYIGSKLEDNITNILCPVPGCSGSLDVELCRSILPARVFERWDNALCKNSINVSEKFYCPFADCSALLIKDSTETVRKIQCPNCNRMFCVQCKAPWHEGIECSEFEKLNANERNKEAYMLMNLAKNMAWRRCPNCKFYVEKSDGCRTINCRCGCNFCYTCGDAYVDNKCICGTDPHLQNHVQQQQHHPHQNNVQQQQHPHPNSRFVGLFILIIILLIFALFMYIFFF